MMKNNIAWDAVKVAEMKTELARLRVDYEVPDKEVVMAKRQKMEKK